MSEKTTTQFYRTGEFAKCEAALDAQSEAGWQVTRAGRLRQHFQRDERALYRHLYGYCDMPAGTPSRTAYIDAAKAAGWQPVCETGGWILFRKQNAAPDEQLPDGRDGIAALYAKRTKRCENVRIWVLVLSAVLMIGGYVSDMVYLIYSSVLPLAVALILTYRVRFMQIALK